MEMLYMYVYSVESGSKKSVGSHGVHPINSKL